MLTGRNKALGGIRHKGGISGFPKLDESEFDHFGTGHSSTSISAILGMAEAAALDGLNRNHIAIIGDGSLSGGMSFEALNNLGRSKANVLVVVNDNKMGIDPSTGALTAHLNALAPMSDAISVCMPISAAACPSGCFEFVKAALVITGTL